MPSTFPTLRDFLDALDRDGELARVRTKVSTALEIAAVADRAAKTVAPHPPAAERDKHPSAKLGGKALLFENVDGSIFPSRSTRSDLLARQQGAGDRLARRAGGARAAAGEAGDPRDAHGEDEAAAGSFENGVVPPRVIKSGICQEVVHEGDRADLNMLPIIQCWPLDGDLLSGQVFDSEAAARAAKTQTGTGKYITLGGVHTRKPGDRRPQHRDVPRAGARPAQSGDALAPASRRGTPFSDVEGAGGKNAAGDRAGRGERHAVRRDRPTAAGHRGAVICGLPQRRRDRAGAVPDDRPAGAGELRDRY
jgi:hypothetical protein